MNAAEEQSRKCTGVDGSGKTEAALWDEKTALQRMDGDQELLLELIRLFLVDFPNQLSNLADAVERREGNLIEHYAHTIKGTVANFDAHRVIAEARLIEQCGSVRDFLGIDEKTLHLRVELEALAAQLQQSLR